MGATDYYPFGMPMPGRQIVGGEPYRYAYQGQEKDPETGKEAFQLRLWDGRIGRWLTTDPYGQFDSPYLGMGNNPVIYIDEDGGWVIITGAIGALINGGINIYSQYKEGTLDFSSGKTWARLGVAAGGGFIAGATGNLSVAVAANTAGDFIDQAISNDGDLSKINYTQTLASGLFTFAGGKITGKIVSSKTVSHYAIKAHEKVLGRSAYSYGGIANKRAIDYIVHKESAEIFGGLFSGGTSSINYNTDYVKRVFSTPNFDKLRSSLNNFHNQFMRDFSTMNFSQQMNRSSNIIWDSPATWEVERRN